MRRARDVADDVRRSLVDERVGRIEPQPVDVVLADPVHGVLDDETAHHLAARPIQVDGAPPGRLVPVGEVVRMDLREVGPFGTEVVVDDVEQDGQPEMVRLVDEAAQIVGRPYARDGA